MLIKRTERQARRGAFAAALPNQPDGGLDRRSFKRGVFQGKRPQNHALWWAANGSGWKLIVNADRNTGQGTTGRRGTDRARIA